MAVLLIPPYLQFFDANGDPLSLGKVYTYAAGTTAPKATFTDSTSDFQAANPVILDSAGRTTMWGSGSYKFAVYDANDNLIETTDNYATYTTIEASSESYFQAFSGNGSQTAFTLSSDLGTDENAIMVFVSDGLEQCVTNGTFASDTGWTKGAGWTIAAGVATATGAISTALSQTSAVTLIEGQSYNLIYTVTRSAGGVIPSIGGTNGTERTSAGTFRETIIAGSTQVIAFTGNGFTGTVDTITITPSDFKGYDIQAPTSYTLSGTTLTFGSAPPSGTGNIYVFAPSALVAAASASADAADASATIATNAATTATTQAGIATTQATTATTQAGIATTQANLAIAAASAALLSSGIVSVAQYTAGGTADDTTLFQAAIDAAVAAGKMLFVPPATYTVSTITVSGNLLMYGVPDSTIIKQKDSTTGDMITSTGTGCKVFARDMIMDGNQANQSAQSANSILRSTADGGTGTDVVVLGVENVEFRNRAFAAVRMDGDNATGTREIFYLNDCRFYDGAESVENVGTDYIPRDIALGDSVEVYIDGTDHDSATAPTIAGCALVIGQTQSASIRYTEGFARNMRIRRRGANVSQGLGSIDAYIWAKNFHFENINLIDSLWCPLKWKCNGSSLHFRNIIIDGVPTDISPVNGNQSTTNDVGDGIFVDGLHIRNASYAANYLVVIEGKSATASAYSKNVHVRNVTFDSCTGSGVVIYNTFDPIIENVTFNGGVIAASFQICDGTGIMRNITQVGGSSAAAYIDNNAATFDYLLENVVARGNTHTSQPVYASGRNGVIRDVVTDGSKGVVQWGAHTRLHIAGCVGTNLDTAAVGFLSNGTVTDLTVQNCYVPTSVVTPLTAGTYTNLHASGNSFAVPANAQFRAGTATLATALSAANGGTGLTALGTGVATFLGTPSSANLASAVTDETGSGLLVFATSPTITTPRIVGVTNGSDATAGDVGEFLSVTVLAGAAVSLSSTVTANITSLSLGAGDFDVTGNCVWQGTASTSWTQIDGQINSSSAAFASFPASGAAMRHSTAALVSSGPFAHSLGQRRFSSSGAQTAYLNASATFSVSTASAYGFLGARRRR
jgi:hypothetical protein